MGFLKFLLKKLHFHRIGNISPCDTWWLSHSNLWRALYQCTNCTNQCTNWPAPVVIGVGARWFQDLGIGRLRLTVKTSVENVLVGQRTMEVLQQSRDICEILFLVPQVIAAVRAGRCLLWRNYNRPHGSDFLFGFGSCSQCFGKWTSEFCTFYIILDPEKRLSAVYIIHQSSETLVYCH